MEFYKDNQSFPWEKSEGSQGIFRRQTGGRYARVLFEDNLEGAFKLLVRNSECARILLVGKFPLQHFGRVCLSHTSRAAQLCLVLFLHVPTKTAAEDSYWSEPVVSRPLIGHSWKGQVTGGVGIYLVFPTEDSGSVTLSVLVGFN